MGPFAYMLDDDFEQFNLIICIIFLSLKQTIRLTYKKAYGEFQAPHKPSYTAVTVIIIFQEPSLLLREQPLMTELKKEKKLKKIHTHTNFLI